MSIKSMTLGLLGGGQLGRMSALAAARLGIKTCIYCPEGSSPAFQVSASHICGDYEDRQKLKAFADQVDVISYEFENIPVETVSYLQDFKPVYPDKNLLEVSQNRLKEKRFLNDIGIPTAPWLPARNAEDISRALTRWNVSECILKTARFGYDGKGQVFHRDNDTIQESWSNLNTQEAVIEGVVNFDFEISVIVARDRFGHMESYPAVLNEHRNHILWKTTAPAPISGALQKEASNMAKKIATEVKLIGVLALELFVTKDGGLLANEIAPRTHNSGHWSIDACAVSQFEQHVRAVCGLPVAPIGRHSDAEMINLIGNDVDNLQQYLDMESACIHLYGKEEARRGRKMGHVTILKDKRNESCQNDE
ncbi:MAG: 5-(carboxyamino)imidazole ribonucleotide synthase [Rhodospirillales bacterium]|nr:5-(carboxyamino)imidazole ribonucleotide synthase [Alphaproteobacteria bacterium]USO03486.1 MAG: 5-(carboxyamino)imidazole ribonucleotide synthase [Rhodospirillales bacterium]